MPVPPVIQMYRYVMGSGGGLGNLLKASEEFQQTVDWVRYPTSSQTPTVNADSRPDPNGGTTADQVDYTANTSARLMQTVTLKASTQYTFSVHARAVSGTVDFRMRNITLKAAVQKTATTTGPLTNGFTRFTYTFTTGAAGSYELALQNASGTPTARSVIFWGAMLNQGGTAADYEYSAPTTGGSAPAPAYAGFGDAFGGVTAYYSLRQFTEAETLNAIRVRRSSDDTEQDIGFDANGDLDTTALLAFVGTGGTDNGFVTTFYDQTGNGNNATNATASEQPLVVSGGTLVTENGKAALDFDGSAQVLQNSVGASDLSNVSMFVTAGISQTNDDATIVTYPDIGTNGGVSIGQGGVGTAAQIGLRYRISGVEIDTDGIALTTGQKLLSALCTASTTAELFENGTAGALNVSARLNFNNFEIGAAGNSAFHFDGTIQEVVIFESDQSSNRTSMETNINDHFSIYP